jgi:hypothetical protein
MFLAFHDLSTAFDRIGRNGRFYLLWQNGIHGKHIRLCIAMLVGRLCL